MAKGEENKKDSLLRAYDEFCELLDKIQDGEGRILEDEEKNALLGLLMNSGDKELACVGLLIGSLDKVRLSSSGGVWSIGLGVLGDFDVVLSFRESEHDELGRGDEKSGDPKDKTVLRKNN